MTWVVAVAAVAAVGGWVMSGVLVFLGFGLLRGREAREDGIRGDFREARRLERDAWDAELREARAGALEAQRAAHQEVVRAQEGFVASSAAAQREWAERWERLLESRRAELEELRVRHVAELEGERSRWASERAGLLDRVQVPSEAAVRAWQATQGALEGPRVSPPVVDERDLEVDEDLGVDHFLLRGA